MWLASGKPRGMWGVLGDGKEAGGPGYRAYRERLWRDDRED